MKKFIPAFRIKAAKMMIKEYGVKQQQAALILGTTQAAISKYLKENHEKFNDVNIESSSLREFVGRMKANDKRNAQKVMCTMCQGNKKFDRAFIVR